MNIQDIKEEIEILEKSETNWQNIEKLSWLYSIRSNYRPKFAAKDKSEFIQACEDADFCNVFEALDEHMNVIKVLHPKEYVSLIEKIKGLK